MIDLRLPNEMFTTARLPILSNKAHQAPSVFTPDNLLREARRQKSVPTGTVPRICVLDPDGDIVHYLIETEQVHSHPHWACYHTEMYNFVHQGVEYGIIGHAVGASFAVLVAEECSDGWLARAASSAG